ncbi:MAG: hypothetical protein ACRDJX_10140 [Solirubrobacteraceae bacterium]
MSPQQTPDPLPVQDAIDRSRPPRMPPASLAIRLKTSRIPRKLVPTRLVVNRAERQAQALWQSSAAARARAIAVMQSILAGTARAHEVEELAPLHLIEAGVDRALFWQPWSASMDGASSALLRNAASEKRGVILSASHLGPHFCSLYALPPELGRPYSVVGPWFLEPPSHDYWGRRLARWRKGALGHPVLSEGSYPTLMQVLSRGETVYLFFDLPGRRQTRLLGKQAMLADGTARLAIEADVPVLPLRARRIGHRAWVDVGSPLDPREYCGVKALHNSLALVHERQILENPAAMTDPNSFGWDGGARAGSWKRP